jgi:hypothetical protein
MERRKTKKPRKTPNTQKKDGDGKGKPFDHEGHEEHDEGQKRRSHFFFMSFMVTCGRSALFASIGVHPRFHSLLSPLRENPAKKSLEIRPPPVVD